MTEAGEQGWTSYILLGDFEYVALVEAEAKLAALQAEKEAAEREVARLAERLEITSRAYHAAMGHGGEWDDCEGRWDFWSHCEIDRRYLEALNPEGEASN